MTSAGNLSLTIVKQLLGQRTGWHPVSLQERHLSTTGKHS